MFIVYLSFEKSVEERKGEMKYFFWKSSLKFTFGRDDCRKSDFAKPNSSKVVLLEIF